MLVIIASKIIAEPIAVVIKSSFIPTAATAIIKLNLDESKTPAEMLSFNQSRPEERRTGNERR